MRYDQAVAFSRECSHRLMESGDKLTSEGAQPYGRHDFLPGCLIDAFRRALAAALKSFRKHGDEIINVEPQEGVIECSLEFPGELALS